VPQSSLVLNLALLVAFERLAPSGEMQLFPAVTISFKRGWERTWIDVRRQDPATAIANSSNPFEIK